MRVSAIGLSRYGFQKGGKYCENNKNQWDVLPSLCYGRYQGAG